jgi:hypothetical protein
MITYERDIYALETSETGLYYALRNQSEGFSTDTLKCIRKYSDGSIVKFPNEQQWADVTTGVIGLNGETGLQGVTGTSGTSGSKGETGVMSIETGGFTGLVLGMTGINGPVYTTVNWVVVGDDEVHLTLTEASGFSNGFYASVLFVDDIPTNLLPYSESYFDVPSLAIWKNNGQWNDTRQPVIASVSFSKRRLYFWAVDGWSTNEVKGWLHTIYLKYKKHKYPLSL